MLPTPRAERGQAAIVLVLALTALLGFVALAVDGGLIYTERRHAQNASDASSLAGGAAAALSLENSQVTYQNWNCNDPRIAAASASAINAGINRAQGNDFVVDADDSDHNSVGTVCGQHDNGSFVDKYLDITTLIRNPIDTYFMQFVYRGPVINNVETVTRVRPRAPIAYGHAIVATRTDCPSSDTGGVHFDGNNDVHVTGGGIFSNACIKAGGSLDVDVDGGGEITCVGYDCYSQSGHPGISPSPDEESYQLRPKSYDVPPPNCSGLPARAVDSNVLQPGRYSQIRVQNSDNLTMSPGLYCVGNFNMTGGKLAGTGVTIYITTGDFSINGGEIDIIAPPARNCSYCPPPLPGVLIYLAPGNTGEIVLLGNSVSEYLGLIYAPDGTIEVGGTAGEVSQIHAQLVADTVKIHGNAELVVNFDDALTYQTPALIELYR